MSSTSRFRSSSLSPSKQSRNEITQIYYPSPNDKQFIAFSNVEKESGMGMVFHQRLLLFDSMHKTFRYYSKTPEPLPHPEMPLPQGKQMIKIKAIKNFEFKSTRTGIGKANVKWSDLNNQKKQWNLKFANNNLMNSWIILVNQAIKQGHLQPQNRPKNPTREAPPKNIQKYLTPFILETGGVASRRNSTAQSQVGGVLTKDNSIWLTQEIEKKQKEVNQIHNKMHQSTSMKVEKQDESVARQKQGFVQQNQETQEKEKAKIVTKNNQRLLMQRQRQKKQEQKKLNVQDNNDSIKTIKKPLNEFPFKNPSVILEENQSKVSQNSVQVCQSAKDFRINRQPIPIPEDEQIEESMVRNGKPEDRIKNQANENESEHIKHGSHTRTPKTIQNSSNSTQQKPFQVQQKTTGSSLHSSINQSLPKKLGEAQFANSNIFSMMRKQQLSHNNNKNNNETGYDWTPASKYQPLVYANFIQMSQQICSYIVQNIGALIKECNINPTSSLFCTSSDLFIRKNNIQFRVPLQLHRTQQWQTSLKMRQYTSVIGYIRRLTKHSLPLQNPPHKNYSIQTIIPIPYCCIRYQLHEIKCKALLSEYYTLIQEKNERTNIDRFFGMPSGLWSYYYNDDGTLVVDYGVDDLVIQSHDDQSLLNQIVEDLGNMQTNVGHYLDFKVFCSFGYNLSVNQSNILYMLKKCIICYQWQSPCRILLSILYSLKSSTQISNLISQKMQHFSSTQLNQAITSLIHSYSSKPQYKIIKQLQNQLSFSPSHTNTNNSTHNHNHNHNHNHINRQIMNQSNINNLLYNVNIQKLIDQHCVFNSLVQIFGLEPAQDRFRLRFGVKGFGVGVAVMCEEMENVCDILVRSFNQNWQDQRKYWGYQQIVKNLNKFQYLWNQSSQKLTLYSTKQPQHTLLQKYGTLYPEILSYLSLFQPYTPSSALIHSHHTHPHSHTYTKQLQQIFRSYPPTALSYSIQINCIKWITKGGITSHEMVESMLIQSIQKCKKWSGNNSLFLLAFYELFVAYSESIMDVHRAVQYARYAIEVVNSVFGEDSLEAAERWFVLANSIMQDSTMYQQAIQSYTKSLSILSLHQPTQPYSPRPTLLSWDLPTCQPQLTIRLKLIKLYLAQGIISKCLQECSISLQLSQVLKEPNYDMQLEIFSALIRCLQLSGSNEKLEAILDVAAQKFGQGIRDEVRMKEKMLKMCLAPYLALKLTEENRKLYLSKLVSGIRKKYERRYTKKQYTSYLSEKLAQSGQLSQLIWFLNIIIQLPLFSPYMRVRNRDNTAEVDDINYSLYENAFTDKFQPVTQSKLLVPALRALQAVAGVVGYAYLEACFLK